MPDKKLGQGDERLSADSIAKEGADEFSFQLAESQPGDAVGCNRNFVCPVIRGRNESDGQEGCPEGSATRASAVRVDMATPARSTSRALAGRVRGYGQSENPRHQEIGLDREGHRHQDTRGEAGAAEALRHYDGFARTNL